MKGSWHYLILGGSWEDLMRMLKLACPTACACLFKLRPGVLSKTLSDIWGKLNLPMLTVCLQLQPEFCSRENLLNLLQAVVF